MDKKQILIALTVLLLTIISPFAQAADYYWIGDGGDWTDLNHWATSSGGSTLHTVLPGTDDNIIFDENSFNSTDQSVNFNTRVEVNDFTALTIDETITFSSSISDIEIFGSFRIGSSAVFDIDNFLVSLKSDLPNNEVAIERESLTAEENGTLSFIGSGSYTLSTDVTLSKFSIYEGSVTTGNHIITARDVETRGSGTKNLIFDNTRFFVQNWRIISVPSSLSVADSEITVSSTFTGSGLTYHKVLFTEVDNSFYDISLEDDNTFDSLVLQGGTIVELAANSLQTVTSALVFEGTQEKKVSLTSANENAKASITGSNILVNGTYPVISHLDFTGSATFDLNNGLLINSLGWELASIVQPTTRGNYYFSKVLTESMYVATEPGDGNERLIFMREGSSFPDITLTQGTFYTADNTYGNGASVGTETFLVYQGNDQLALIEGLKPNTQYGVAVIEANVNPDRTAISYHDLSASFSKSNVTNSENAIYQANDEVTVQEGDKIFDDGGSGFYFPGKNLDMVLNSGEPGKNINLSFSEIELRYDDTLSIYNGNSTDGELLSRITSTQNNTQQSLELSEIVTLSFSSSDFEETAFGFEGWEATVSLAIPSPTIASSDAVTTSEQADQIDFTFTKGDGSGRLIIAKEGTNDVIHQPDPAITYTPDQQFAQGTSLGNNEYVIAYGDIDAVSLTGLKALTYYSLKIYEYNESGDEIVFSPEAYAFRINNILDAPVIGTQSVTVTDTTATSATIAIEPGDGDGRMILIGPSNINFSASLPNEVYNANNVYGEGDVISNYFVVGFGDITSLTITDLPARKPYKIYSIEYNVRDDFYQYAENFGSTEFDNSVKKPDIQSADFVLKSNSTDNIDFSFMPGNGDGRLIIMKDGISTINSVPEDDRIYSANSRYKSGGRIISNEYIVGYGDLSQINITNLTAESDYTVKIFEYNQEGDDISYADTGYEFTVTTRVVLPPVDITSSFSVEARKRNIYYIAADSALIGLNITFDERNNSQLLVLASESPINPTAVRDVLVDDVVVDVDNNFGSTNEVLPGVFGIDKLNIYGSVTRQSLMLQSLKPSTEYFLHFLIVNENVVGARYGHEGASGISFTTKAANTILIGPDTVEISDNRIIYSANGYGSRGYAAAQTVFKPAKSDDKLAIDFYGLHGLSQNPIEVYDGLPSEENLILNVDRLIDSDTLPILVVATNPEGILTVRNAVNSFNTSASALGFEGVIYTKSEVTVEKPLPVKGLRITDIKEYSTKLSYYRGSGSEVVVILRRDENTKFRLTDGFELKPDEMFREGVSLAYRGTGTEISLNNLSPDRQYYADVYEVSGSGKNVSYSQVVSGSFRTQEAGPLLSATNLNSTVLDSTTVRLKWKNGNGERRIVIAMVNRINDFTEGQYLNGKTFIANNNLKTTQNYGSWIDSFYILYDGTADSVDVYNISEYLGYTFYVAEYSDDGISVNYRLSNSSSFSSEAGSPSSISPVNLTVTDTTINSARIEWSFEENRFYYCLVFISTVDEGIPVTSGRIGTPVATENGMVYSFREYLDSEVANLLEDTEYFVRVYSVITLGNLFSVNEELYAKTSFTTKKADDYYWVGGSGSWHDLTHWATTSGGSEHPEVLPSQYDNLIIDEHSANNEENVQIITHANRYIYIYSIIARNLTTRFTIGDPVDDASLNKQPHLIHTGNLSTHDSLYFNFSRYEALYSVPSRAIDYNLVPGNQSLGFTFHGVDSRLMNLDLSNLPNKIDYLSIYYADIYFGTATDTLEVDYYRSVGSTATNMPALINLHGIQTSHEVPFISTLTEEPFEINSNLRVPNLEINSELMSIAGNYILSVDSIIKPDDQLLRIQSKNNYYTTFVDTEKDSLIINNAEIYNNHAIGNSVYIARNSILSATSGWQTEGSKTPSSPTFSQSVNVGYGDSTYIEISMDTYSDALEKHIALIREADQPQDFPEANVFYKSTRDMNEADKAGNSYVIDLGVENNISITGLVPDTEYIITMFAYRNSEDKISYGPAGVSEQVKTARLEDEFFLYNTTKQTVADDKTIYWSDGIGHDPARTFFHENATMVIAPEQPDLKSAVYFRDITYCNQVIGFYRGKTVADSMLMRTIDVDEYYRTYGSRINELFVSDSEDGYLTIKFEDVNSAQSYSDGKLSFGAISVSGELPAEPLAPTGLTATEAQPNRIKLEWTPAPSAYTIIKAGIYTDDFSPIDRLNYEADSLYGEGDLIGYSTVVYNGDGNSVYVSGLEAKRSYNFTAYSYSVNDRGTPNYLSSEPIKLTTTTPIGKPTYPPSVNLNDYNRKAISVGLSLGNNRVVDVLGLLKEGSPVTSSPIDDTDYTGTFDLSQPRDIMPDDAIVVVQSGQFSNIYISLEGLKE
ncbi:MAG: hypothetical protein WBA74_22550, partial [Cyclobacteriaceae bacterium]